MCIHVYTHYMNKKNYSLLINLFSIYFYMRIHVFTLCYLKIIIVYFSDKKLPVYTCAYMKNNNCIKYYLYIRILIHYII